MAMTLEQVRDRLRKAEDAGGLNLWAGECGDLADALDAHLSQPAQAVDVGAIEAVIRELCKWPKEETFYDDRATRLACAEKLRARSTAQAVDVGSLRETLCRIAADNHKSALTLGQEGLRGQCIETSKELHKLTRAIGNAQAEVRGVDGWTARRDDELRLWRVYSPSGDVAGVYDQAAGVHAEVLRQLAQSLPATPPQPEE